MRIGNLEIPLPVVQNHYEAGVEALRSNAAFAQLAAETANIAQLPAQRHRQDSVALMPLTQFAIQTTLGILQDPTVAHRLPREVSRRASIAQNFARHLIGNVVTSDIATRYYIGNPHLEPLYRRSDSHLPELLSGQGEAFTAVLTLGELAIMDTSTVVGGAFKFLQRDGQLSAAESPVALIGNSRSLPDITGVPDDHLPHMRRFLKVPYAHHDHFVRAPGAVDFKDSTQEFLKGLYAAGKGCPARYIPVPAETPTTVLRQSWMDITTFLLPADATVSGNRGAASRKKR